LTRPARFRRAEQAGKNSFPRPHFLFARLLGLRPEIFSADGLKIKRMVGEIKIYSFCNYILSFILIFVKTLHE